jgi:hypothetical protein
MADTPKPEETAKIDHNPPLMRGWMDEPVDIKAGIYCYGSKPKNLDYVDMPYAKEWNPTDDDWILPENWKGIIQEGF